MHINDSSDHVTIYNTLATAHPFEKEAHFSVLLKNSTLKNYFQNNFFFFWQISFNN